MTETDTTTRLIELISPWVNPLGYEIVHVEVVHHRQRSLRLFIDRLAAAETRAIGIEDCVAVSRALNEPLDALPEIEKIFKGPYELEVSSPGLDRPLRTPRDFEKFSGREIRVHVFRPLTAEELGNPGYQTRNPKQKNFLGTLRGLRNQSILLAVSPQSGPGTSEAKGMRRAKTRPDKTATPTQNGPHRGEAGLPSTKSADEVSIPLPLIAKANLEPSFEDFQAAKESE
jgi:ribosome maturation factor RimP